LVQTAVMEMFMEEIVGPVRNRVLLHWEQLYQANRKPLKEAFIRHFDKLCREVAELQSIGEKGAIGHFTYSMLRTRLQEGRGVYLVEASDETWLFDPASVAGEYDASWAFGYLDELQLLLEEERQRPGSPYTGGISRPDLEKLLLRESQHGHQYVIALLRWAMPEAMLTEGFRKLEQCGIVEVRVGEYLDISESVYRKDSDPMDETEIRKWLAERIEGAYGYGALERLDLAGGDYSEMDFRYSAFRESAFGGSSFAESNLVGTVWEGCDLTDTEWNQGWLHGASFENCRLVGALFHRAEADCGLPDPENWEIPGFHEVSFAGADLSEAEFVLARLRGARFTGAKLTGAILGWCDLTDADFRGADLRGTNFSGSCLTGAQMDTGACSLLSERPEMPDLPFTEEAITDWLKEEHQ
jgi:BTB/POZ domain-containing protein KCTD9